MKKKLSPHEILYGVGIVLQLFQIIVGYLEYGIASVSKNVCLPRIQFWFVFKFSISVRILLLGIVSHFFWLCGLEQCVGWKIRREGEWRFYEKIQRER